MENWLDRLLTEHYELNLKILKLSNFILASTEYKKMNKEDQLLLQKQLDLMSDYLFVLALRIYRADNNEQNT